MNCGCILIKIYLYNVEIIENIGYAVNCGIVIENFNFIVDMDKFFEIKFKVVNILVGGVVGFFCSYGVIVYKGIGIIIKDKNVLVNGFELFEIKKIIFVGGLKVSKINIFGMEFLFVMISDDIFEMNEVLESFVIIGGGVVGIEFG